jgi:Domain of unknown function (DUF4145)
MDRQMDIEIPHLSVKCWKCRDSTSMPPRSRAALVHPDYDQSRYANRYGGVPLYAVLHTCTNENCLGASIGYYSEFEDRYLLEFHTPQYRAYKASEEIPPRPRQILQDANDSAKSPVACVSAAVRAIEAMLAEKGYNERKDGLLGRIKKAIAAGQLPGVMADWALEVREIGTETHTDEAPLPLPSAEEAERALTFANLLASYLFELPAIIRDHRLNRKSRSASGVKKSPA